MSNARYGVPKWHYGWRRNLILLICVVVAAIASATLFWAYPRFTDDPAPRVSTPVPAGTSPSYGLPPYGLDQAEIAARIDNGTAISIKRQRPKLYNDECRTYPADEHLRMQHLIPTVNVNIVITYDKLKGEYVATADGQIEMKVNGQTQTIEGEGGPHVVQEFTWAYRADDVQLYGGAMQEKHENGALRWARENLERADPRFTAATGPFSILVPKKYGDSYPTFIFMATDGTCKSGDVPVPDQKTLWSTFAKNGVLEPQIVN